MRNLYNLGCVILVAATAACSGFFGNNEAEGGPDKYLWNASLETLSFLPLQTADPFSGRIETGWGQPQGGGAPLRATVVIGERGLNLDALQVAVFRRSGSDGVPAAEEKRLAVESAILLRARQLREFDVRNQP